MAGANIRSTKKRLFTTESDNLRRHILSEDIGCVDQCLMKLSALFKDQIAHYNYIDDANIDYEDVETYFNCARDTYEDVLKKVHDMRNNSQSGNNSRGTPDNTIASLVEMAALPRLEIESFSGDILKYKEFISVFEETVGASSCGSRLKLNLLLKSTIGDAISKYTLMEAEEGYKKAKQKLEERFGSPYLFSSVIIEDIQSGKPAKTPAEL